MKRVHPDYNGHRLQWSHKAMTTINLAYETVRAYLDDERQSPGRPGTNEHAGRSRRYSGGGRTDGAGARSASSREQGTDPRDGSRHAEEGSDEFAQRFAASVNAILDGMYLYYQYGLENVHLRHEGVRRFRYRSAVRQLREGIQRLEQLDTLQKSRQESEHLALFKDFSKAFLQNIRIDKYYIPQRMPGEHNAYQHYSNGSTQLDKAIKSRFFEELETSFEERSVAGGLQVSYHEFMTVLVKYANSTWIPETMIKFYLLQLFEKVSQLDMAG